MRSRRDTHSNRRYHVRRGRSGTRRQLPLRQAGTRPACGIGEIHVSVSRHEGGAGSRANPRNAAGSYLGVDWWWRSLVDGSAPRFRSPWAGAAFYEDIVVRHAVPSCVVTNEDIVRRVICPSNGAIGPTARCAWNATTIFSSAPGPRHAIRSAPMKPRSKFAIGGRSGARRGQRQGRRSRLHHLRRRQPRLARAFDGFSRPARDCRQGRLFRRHGSLRELDPGDAGRARFLRIRNLSSRDVVNCECATANLALRDIHNGDDLERSLAAYTIGEAATATVVAGNQDSDLYITMKSYGEHYDLCMISFANAGVFARASMASSARQLIPI